MNAMPEAIPLDAVACARLAILEPAGLDESHIERALGTLLGAAIDGGDLYFQVSREEHWSLEDSIVKEGSYSIESGVGVRALAGERTGFAYSDEILPEALLEAARAARAIARGGGDGRTRAWQAVTPHALYLPIDPILTLADTDKVACWSTSIARRGAWIRASSR